MGNAARKFRVKRIAANEIQTDSLFVNGNAVAGGLALGSSEVVDLNGEVDALILDADGDTTISAPTDDQIDFEISGADDFRMTANTFTALAGSSFATNAIAETTAGSGVTVDGVLVKDGGAVFADGATIEVDTVNEATAAAGVTADGVLLKDGGIVCADAATLEVDTVNEATSAAGVTADGVLLKDGGIVCADAATLEVDTVNEATSAAGVTVDGVLIKDGTAHAGRASQELTSSGAITINSGLVLLNHATVAVETTLDAPAVGDELIITNNSASGTAAHKVTVPGGVTWDGTNTVATLDAPGETLHVIAISAARWLILENIGTVGLS